MFGTGKRLENLQNQIESLREQLAAFQDRAAGGARESAEAARTASEKLSALAAAANRHDMAIADMLDTWEEWREGQKQESDALRRALADAARQEARESAAREHALLELALACQDQFFALRRLAARTGDRAWGRQLDLMEEKLSASRLCAGLEMVGRKGEPVNYALHEVLGVAEAAKAEQAMRVADIVSPGYAYRGQVVRKAGITAFQAPRGGPDGAAADKTMDTEARGGAEEGVE